MCSIDDASNLILAEHVLNSHHRYRYRHKAKAAWGRGHDGAASVRYPTEDAQQLLVQFPSAKLFDDEQILHQTAISQGLNKTRTSL